MQRKVINILIVIVAAALLICALLLGRNLYQNAKEAREFEEISSLFPEVSGPPEIIAEVSDDIPADLESENTAGTDDTEEVSDTEETEEASGSQSTSSGGSRSSSVTGKAVANGPSKESSEAWKAWWEVAAGSRFSVYQSLAEANPDIAGWVRIEGTAIDYPVCYTPYDPEKYLHLDTNQEYSGSGTPFIEAACTLEPRSSLLIYGHHMRSGAMFAALQNYTSVSYYNAHPYIQFDTPNEAGTYVIAAVLSISANGDQTYWQKLLFPSTEDEFYTALDTVNNLKLYYTGINISINDELLALVTCEYTHDNGRLVIIAKRI